MTAADNPAAEPRATDIAARDGFATGGDGPPLKQVVYVSQTHPDYGPEVLRDILAVSRTNNRRDEITGILVYFDGRFLQYLEGQAPALNATLARIRKDPRHHDVSVLIDTPASRRLFGKWDMGCVEVGSDSWRQIVEADWPGMRRLKGDKPSGLDVLLRLSTAHDEAEEDPAGLKNLGRAAPPALSAGEEATAAGEKNFAGELTQLKSLRRQIFLLIVFLVVLTVLALGTLTGKG